jgi:hypothetical protein
VDESEAKDTVPLPLMWVFTNKFDENGYLLKEKARIVARGDLHITDDDTYAATLAAQTFRAVMALVAGFDLETRQYDVVNAFANAQLPQPVYYECPEGYGQPGKIWKVLIALYGLRTSPLLWYKDFTDGLRELGLEPVPDTNCLFVSNFMILMFYVDDIVIAYREKDQYRVDEFEQKLQAKYEVRELGEAKHFLGIRIVRDRTDRKLWLLQDSYIDKMADKFHIKPTKIPKTPLPSTDLVKYEGKASKSQIQGY